MWTDCGHVDMRTCGRTNGLWTAGFRWPRARVRGLAGAVFPSQPAPGPRHSNGTAAGRTDSCCVCAGVQTRGCPKGESCSAAKHHAAAVGGESTNSPGRRHRSGSRLRGLVLSASLVETLSPTRASAARFAPCWFELCLDMGDWPWGLPWMHSARPSRSLEGCTASGGLFSAQVQQGTWQGLLALQGLGT